MGTLCACCFSIASKEAAPLELEVKTIWPFTPCDICGAPPEELSARHRPNYWMYCVTWSAVRLAEIGLPKVDLRAA